MFFEANEARFLFSVPSQPASFQVLRFSGTEYISQCFEFHLTLVCEQEDLALAPFLYQPCELTLKTPDGTRVLAGIVHQFSVGDTGSRLTEYHVVMKPKLALLQHRVNSRIFQQKTAKEIITQLLQETGFTALDFRWRLNEKHLPRDYCVQYTETDYDFIHRILSESGIHYHFETQGDVPVLIFGDANAAFAKGVTMSYSPASGLNPDQPALRDVQTFWRTISGKISGRDYMYTRPDEPLQSESVPTKSAQNLQSQFTADSTPSAQAKPSEKLERYHWPTLTDTDETTQNETNRSQARHLQKAIELAGITDHAGLMAGKFSTFQELPRHEFEPLWLVRQVEHQGEQPQVLEETSGGQARYQNRFIAIPWQIHFLPEWYEKRPEISGCQTAIVTGPEGQEIYTDEHGRIKVQFHWDREGQADEKTSCWLRVAQGWAGDRYGSHWTPRIGQEVVVSFEHGNPDRPLVLGCVYNGANAHPYELPAHKTRTVFKSLSSPGGGGYNELRFEDKKGQEQIYLHAQRNWELMVKANAYATIDGDSHRITHGNAVERVKQNRSDTIDESSYEELHVDDQLKLKGILQIQVDQSFYVSVGDELHQHAAVKINMEASSGITLKAGGSYVTISPSGVRLVAPSISLNGGAAPLIGSDPNLVEVLKPIGAVVHTARQQKAAAAKICPYRKK